MTSGKEIPWLREVPGAFALSWDGKWLATANADKTVRVWEVDSGKEVQCLHGRSMPVGPLAFSRDGKRLATSSLDNTARLWEVSSGRELRNFRGHTGVIHSLALSEDGRWLATGSIDNTARLWEVSTGQEKKRFQGHAQWVHNVALSGDGNWLATSDWSVVGGRGGMLESTAATKTAYVWDTRTGKEVQRFRRHDCFLTALAFSGDGKRLVTADCANTACLWDVASGNEMRRFRGDSVVLSEDGKWLFTGGTDNMVHLWDAASGKEMCRLVSFRDRSWAVVDPQGRYDASNGGDVEGLHWVAGTEPIALKQLKERYYDPGLLAKYMGFNKEPLRKVETFREVKLHPEVTVAEIKPADKKLTLNLTNRGGGIGRVQVFVNGKELLADVRGPKPDIDAKQATLTVDLAGAPVMPGKPNQITVVTWNAEGYLSSRGLDLVWTPVGQADPNPPELYVIVCGVSEYAEPRLNLRFAAKDAEDMAHALELGGKRFLGADKVHLTLLSTGNNPKGHKPTKENIRNAFEAVRKAKPTDLLVVYLAGHGVSLKQGSDEYCYLTSDARGTDTTALADPAVLASWTVTSSELVDWIKKIPALKQVMLLDTCAAGAAAAKLMEHRDLSGDQVRALDRLKDRTGFHVLMGCAANRVSYEASQYSQGLLTYSLLKGMAGAKLREGEYVDVSGLFQYAADEVPQLARGIGGVQKPLVMAPRGTSFDIGRLIESDRNALPLARPKPLILRPLLSNAEDGDDNLKLASLVGKRLADDSFNTRRGSAATTVYVDADELAGAVRPAGTYTIDGMKVRVRLVLKQDGRTLNKLTVAGSTDDLPGLAIKIAEAIRQGIKKP